MIIFVKDFNSKITYDGPTTSIKNFLTQSKDIKSLTIFNYISFRKENYDNFKLKGKNIKTVYYSNILNFLYVFFKNLNILKKNKQFQFHCIYDFYGCLFFTFLIKIFNKRCICYYYLRGMVNRNILEKRKTLKIFYLKILEKLFLKKRTIIVCTSIYEKISSQEIFKKKLNYKLEMNKVERKFMNLKFIKSFKKKNHLNIMFMSNITWKKNFGYLVKILKTLDFKVNLNIYGSSYINEDLFHSYMEDIKNIHDVKYFKSYKYENLSKIIINNHLLFLPTIDENFGHVIVETLLHSRPCLISNNTPWNDIELHGAGFSSPLETPVTFKNYISLLYKMDAREFNEICFSAKNYINSKLKNKIDF